MGDRPSGMALDARRAALMAGKLDLEALKARVDCRQLMEHLGAKRFREGRYSAPWREGSDSGSVEVHADRFHDHVTKTGGSALDIVMLTHRVKLPDAAEWLARWLGVPWESRVPIARAAEAAGKAPSTGPGPAPASVPGPGPNTRERGPKPVAVAEYSYTDEKGELLYQAVRFEPGEHGRSKTFRQRRPDGQGGWAWNVEGVRLVPYNLPMVRDAEVVWVVEGEKDADTLMMMDEVATTNVGGAGKWMAGYSEYLRDKEVLLCGDNDEPGQAHVKKVLESLAGVAALVVLCKVPSPHKDITDYLNAIPWEDRRKALDTISQSGKRLIRGVDLPLCNVADLERAYIRDLERVKTEQAAVDLCLWLPGLRGHVRRLIPGEVVVIVADTGVGKSMVLQNVAMRVPLPTLFFELELPEPLMFERLAAMSLQMAASQIEADYSIGRRYVIKGLDHLCVCSTSGLTMAEITDMTRKAELKMGMPPVVVMIDYVQIVQGGGGGKRYERLSTVAEEIKVFAKATNTVVFVASQVGRKEDQEIQIHDAKDSGSIENSAGLVLGAWRDPKDCDVLILKVLKNTKGRAGTKVRCRINGPTLLITEDGQANGASGRAAPATRQQTLPEAHRSYGGANEENF